MAAGDKDIADCAAADRLLERGYRRLLRWYPRSHRAVYGEEMLGVLIAGTRPGQRRPGTKESANLLAGAVVMRARRAAAWLTTGSWKDAFAVLSLVGPILMMTFAVQDLHALKTLWLAVWPAVLLLALAKRRRPAAGLAGLATGYIAVLALAGHVVPVGDVVSPRGALWIFTGMLAFASLAFSAGPRRGLALLGPLRTALVLAAAAGDALVNWNWMPVVRFGGQGQPASVLWGSLGLYATLLIAASALTRDRAGRRVVALAAPVAALTGLARLTVLQVTPDWGLFSDTGRSTALGCLYLGLAAAMSMLAAATWRAARVTPPVRDSSTIAITRMPPAPSAESRRPGASQRPSPGRPAANHDHADGDTGRPVRRRATAAGTRAAKVAPRVGAGRNIAAGDPVAGSAPV